MIEAATTLVFLALVGASALALFLWPELRRLRKLRRENNDLRREHEELLRERNERSRRILELWAFPETSYGTLTTPRPRR